MRMAFVCSVIVIVFCAGASPASKAQTTAPAEDRTSQESTSVDHSSAGGQNNKSQGVSPGPTEPTEDYSTNINAGLFKRVAKDQIQLWTFPRHLSWEDADILVPFGMGLGGLLPTDSEFSKHLSNSPSRL